MAEEPKANVRIEKTVKDVPVSQDEMDAIEEATSARGPGRQGRPPRTKFPAGSSQIDDEDDFPAFLNDPTVKIFVDRVSPREWKGAIISGQLDEFVPPTTQEEIESEIRTRFGGGRFRIRVVKNGKFIAARGFTVYGNPKLTAEVEDDDDEEVELNPSDFQPPPFRVPYGMPPGSGAPPSDEINQLKINIEKERLKRQLEEVKGEDKPKVDPVELANARVAEARKEFESKMEISNLRNDFDQKLRDVLAAIHKVAETPKRNTEEETSTKLKMMELENKLATIKTEISAEVKSMVTDLKGMLQPLQQPPKDDSALLRSIIEGFSNIAKSNNDRAAAIADADRIKTEAMLTSFKTINDAQTQVSKDQQKQMFEMLNNRNKGESMSEIAKAVSSVRDIAESMGLREAGSSGGGGDDDEPKDITTRIVGIVEQALPTILAQQKQAGRQLSDDELKQVIIQQAEARARQLAPAYAAQFMKQRGLLPQQPLPQQPQVPPTPQTAPGAPVQMNGPAAWAPTSLSPAPTPQAPSQPAPQAPSQPSATAPVATGSTPVPATQTPGQPPGSEQHQNDPVFVDACSRVNDCLETIMSEIRIRPRKPDWVEQAFDELPEAILDRIVRVTTAQELFAVVQPFANPELITSLIEQLKDDKNATWFVNSLNTLKMIYAEDEGEEK